MIYRSKKTIYIALILFLSIGFCIGYAALNTTLTINGTSTIEKNTWDVHFENLKVKEGSIEAIVEPTLSSGTIISNFQLSLNKPGDFYEFTIDVVNNGTLDAMISSIEKTPDLTENQKKYINYIIEYDNGEQIIPNQLIKIQEFVRVKVRVEYKKDISVEELPTETDNLSLGFKINYVQSEDTGIEVLDNGINFISFTFSNITYKAEKDMTWADWINSKYNTSKISMKLTDYVKKYKHYPTAGHDVALLKTLQDASIVTNEIFISADQRIGHTFLTIVYDKNGNYVSGYRYEPGSDIGVHGAYDKSINLQYSNMKIIDKEKYSYKTRAVITFSINDIPLYAEEGMTWEDWVYSEYNKIGMYANTSIYVYTADNNILSNSRDDCITKNNIITSNEKYVNHQGGC